MGEGAQFDANIAGTVVNLGLREGRWAAGETLQYGQAAFAYEGGGTFTSSSEAQIYGKLYGYKLDRTTVTFSGDFVTSNKINGTVTIDGTDYTIAEVDFDTDHATTIAALATAIEAAATGVTATLTDTSGDNRIIAIDVDGSNVSADFVVTAGGSQATDSEVQSSRQTFIGAVIFSNEEQDSNGDSYISVGRPAPVLRAGKIWVECTTAVNDLADVDVIASGTTQGQWAATGVDVGAIARTKTASAGRIMIEFDGRS